MSSAQKDALVWLPIKNNLTEADIANQRFNLAGLMNYPILANRAWLAIPADADEESARAAAKTQAAALQQAQRGLYYEADGITLRDGLWDEDAAAAWRSAVMAALGAESAEADDN